MQAIGINCLDLVELASWLVIILVPNNFFLVLRRNLAKYFPAGSFLRNSEDASEVFLDAMAI